MPVVERLNAFARRLPEAWVWGLGLLPLVWVFTLIFTNALGVDPVREIEHRLGKIGLWFLIGGLCITPLRRLFGVNLLRQRRAIGLLAVFYVALHLLAWLWLDMGLLLSQALQDLVKRPYLFFGISAFVLLIPLALTSNRASIRRLGANWGRLHRLVYPAAALAVLHYLWQMKVIQPEGYLWLGATLLLLGLRLLWQLQRRRRSALADKG